MSVRRMPFQDKLPIVRVTVQFAMAANHPCYTHQDPHAAHTCRTCTQSAKVAKCSLWQPQLQHACQASVSGRCTTGHMEARSAPCSDMLTLDHQPQERGSTTFWRFASMEVKCHKVAGTRGLSMGK